MGNKTEVMGRQFKNEILNHGIVMKDGFSFEDHKRLIYWGIRHLGRERNKPLSLEEAAIQFQSRSFIFELIEMITPRQLMVLFPIEKEFDGDRYGVKDYFYTIKFCKEYGLDRVIQNAFEFLWDYHNWMVSHFIVDYMSLMSDIRRFEGKPGLIEEFAAKNGLKTYQMRDINGATVFIENLVFTEDGKVL